MTGRRKTTDITMQLAGDLVSILDFFSRVMGAADSGTPHYMHDKAAQLAGAADRLHRRMSDESDGRPPFGHDSSKQFDPVHLRALIARQAKYCTAGRALYPLGGDPAAAAMRHALEAAAIAMPFETPGGLTRAQADAVAAWLRERAAGEVSG